MAVSLPIPDEAPVISTAGNVVVMFYPIPVEYEIVEASPEVPYLVAGVAIDLGRMADVLLRIDRIEGTAIKPVSVDPSSIFSTRLTDNLLHPFIRLFESLSDPKEAAFMGELIMDEIYFRLLSGDRGTALWLCPLGNISDLGGHRS